MKTQSWANDDAAFAEFAMRVEATNTRNLLSRRNARITGKNGAGNVAGLVDSIAGSRGAEGRVGIGGQPAIITCYLGKATPVHAVGFYTFNIDARANQDYEVRFADNSASPGKTPTFPAEPMLSTGPKVVGPNSGGFHSRFVREDGKPIVEKADWVEFRIWQTYNVKAGHPAHSKDPVSWTSGIELEVIGAPDDVIVLTPEEIARRKALRAAPRSPTYEKKATWWKTMQSARENLLQWETALDRLLLPDQNVQFGPWHGLGPLDGNDPRLRQVEYAKTMDFGKPVGDMPWTPLPALVDGDLTNVADRIKGKPGQIILLARTATVTGSFDYRNPFTIGVGGRNARFRLAPSSNAIGCPAEPTVPNQKSWDLRCGPGTYNLTARLEIAPDGSAVMYFMPFAPTGSPTAGSLRSRVGRRQGIHRRLRSDFPDAVSKRQLDWETWDSIWIRFQRRTMARKDYELTDWIPGNPAFLAEQYQTAMAQRIETLQAELKYAPAAAKNRVGAWLAGAQSREASADVVQARQAYYDICTLQEAVDLEHRIDSMRFAIRDHIQLFADAYPKGAEYLARTDALTNAMNSLWETVLREPAESLTDVLQLKEKVAAERTEILLDTPLLDFGKLLLVKGGPHFSSNWGGSNSLGNEVVTLSPVKPDGEIKTLFTASRISDLDLHFDANRILFSDGTHLQEINIDGSGLRQISRQDDKYVKHYDGCYLPDGGVMFVSTACEQAVPCTGQWYVGNMHRMELDGTGERRLTFDQDHNWNPCILNNGRVIFTRWEYTDTPHYFSRLLFHMNPDGSGQMEYYGSNSYWPNAMFWPHPIPGHPSEIVCIVSGHHGVSREGELIILDPAKGRFEADGVVQRIPGRGRPVKPVIKDGLVGEEWPRFASPYPLAEPGSHRGAGKYFLVTCRLQPWDSWGIYLVDVFDNMTPILMGSYSNPIPLRPRPCPPAVAPRTVPGKKTGFVFMADVYQGPGIKGYPKGTVKELRIGTHHYRYGGNGDTYASSYDGGWDVKRIIGTVPVQKDGSCLFEAPANTPLFVQPLDENGRALQTMRSWFVVMPGETLSCVGCHEKQNSVAPSVINSAGTTAPVKIRPWYGPTRGFGFDQEVQPVLDRKCAGCHNGIARPDGATIPDFRAKSLHEDYTGRYSPAYLALHPFVRRAGYEADYNMPAPGEFDANTSPLVQMLLKGHHGVELNREEWDRLYTWIDFNIPYAPNWRQSHRPPEDDQVERRAKYKKLYANIIDRDEDLLPAPPVAAFVPPAKPATSTVPLQIKDWPLTPEEATSRQQALEKENIVLELGEGITMEFVPIPTGTYVRGNTEGYPDETALAATQVKSLFYLGKCEVTNAQYACFDPSHDSAYIEGRGKDRFTRGYPANEPQQPVIRISWEQATEFCAWLSQKTGVACSLPTEEEWEWACRAGSATAWSSGNSPADAGTIANIADASISRWDWGRCEKDYQDGVRFTASVGTYPANIWGLHDMIGNVAEWTSSTYDETAPDLKVVRGGSWNDTFRQANSASRWRYPRWQPVYNVGFRVKIDPGKAVALYDANTR